MITNLQYLGIYEGSINSAIESCEDALKRLKFSDREIDQMNEWALNKLSEIGDWYEITNSIIYAYFDTTKYMIEDKHPKVEVDYYVNGDDSHLYVNGEEI